MPRAAPVPLDELLVPLDAELPLLELPDELLPEALVEVLAALVRPAAALFAAAVAAAAAAAAALALLCWKATEERLMVPTFR